RSREGLLRSSDANVDIPLVYWKLVATKDRNCVSNEICTSSCCKLTKFVHVSYRCASGSFIVNRIKRLDVLVVVKCLFKLVIGRVLAWRRVYPYRLSAPAIDQVGKPGAEFAVDRDDCLVSLLYQVDDRRFDCASARSCKEYNVVFSLEDLLGLFDHCLV